MSADNGSRWGRASSKPGCIERYNEQGDLVARRDPVLRVLLDAGEAADEQWLWCMYCERFFQAKDLVIDILGQRQGCPHCGAGGFDIAVHPWDAWCCGDPDWPTSTEELWHGREYPDRRPLPFLGRTQTERWMSRLRRARSPRVTGSREQP